MGVWGLGKVLSKEATMSHFLIGSGKGFIFHQCLRESFKKKTENFGLLPQGREGGSEGYPRPNYFCIFPCRKCYYF